MATHDPHAPPLGELSAKLTERVYNVETALSVSAFSAATSPKGRGCGFAVNSALNWNLPECVMEDRAESLQTNIKCCPAACGAAPYVWN